MFWFASSFLPPDRFPERDFFPDLIHKDGTQPALVFAFPGALFGRRSCALEVWTVLRDSTVGDPDAKDDVISSIVAPSVDSNLNYLLFMSQEMAGCVYDFGVYEPWRIWSLEVVNIFNFGGYDIGGYERRQ